MGMANLSFHGAGLGHPQALASLAWTHVPPVLLIGLLAFGLLTLICVFKCQSPLELFEVLLVDSC